MGFDPRDLERCFQWLRELHFWNERAAEERYQRARTLRRRGLVLLHLLWSASLIALLLIIDRRR